MSKHGQVVGHEEDVADIWSERGTRWNGDFPTTRVRLQYVGDELWLVRKHLDGRWVTVRNATENDEQWLTRKQEPPTDAERITTLERELAEAKAQLTAANATIAELTERADVRGKLAETFGDVLCTMAGETDRVRACAIASDKFAAMQATIAACKAAGFIDAEGRVRKVLGTLPLTADNCIAGFPPGTGGLWYKMPSGHVMQTDPRRMVYEQSARCVLTWLDGYGDVLVSACYSTPAAAKEAQ